MSELVRLQIDQDIAIVTVDNPPVNALSAGVPEGIVQRLKEAVANAAVRGVVLIGAGRTFVAGADIRIFEEITAGRAPHIDLYTPLLEIENSAKPVVAAIHGTAFGGGLELAMACHYRVAVRSAQVGQPEVKLGIIPGAAGTQRLPRLAGALKAAEMCAFGDPVPASAALQAGIVDRVVESDLLAGAVAFLREGHAARRTRELRAEPAREGALDEVRKQARKTKRGQTAPLAAIDAVEAATRMSFEEGCRYESRLFTECLHSPQSRALVRNFFAERTVAKIPGIGKDVPVKEIRRAAVVGAGTMGGGIAMNYANAGIPVLLKDASGEALDRGMATIRRNYANSVKKGRFTQEAMDQRLSLIQPVLSFDGFEQADIVVEAVFESMELKKQVFAEIDRVAGPDAILATNTSTLDIDQIASATHRPESVIGHHFFSPANVMRLIEIVRGKATGTSVIASSMALAKRLNKVGVLVGNCTGFVGNRMFFPYMAEAYRLAEEGAPPHQVDEALYNFGMAMGPLSVDDLAGIDVGWRIRQEFPNLYRDGGRAPVIADLLYDMGRYGQKSGAGFYRYDDNRQKHSDPEVEALLRQVAHEAGLERRQISDKEIVERTVFAMVNEGARILEEGIALRALDIDAIYVNGYGFPAWRGGPMFYADTVGLPKVLDIVKRYWTPADLLVKLASAGSTFEQYTNRASAASGVTEVQK
jgi:3-hydroxyacyl-CoA dehydrogenase